MGKICRACLNNIETGFSIFHLYERYNKSEKIEKMFSAITELEVKIGDGLPTQICHQCLEYLSNAYQFRIQCRESYDSLTENFVNIDNCHEIEVIYSKDSGSELTKENTLESQKKTNSHKNNLSNAEGNPKIEEIYLMESELKIETDIVLQEINPIKIEVTQDIDKVDSYAKKEKEIEISKDVFKQKKISHYFPCYDCKSTFIYRKELLLHIKKVHLPLSDSKTYCDICKNNFPSIQSLYKDLQAHSKNNEIELSVEENKCPFCSRKFRHILVLRKHVEIFHKKALASCENNIEIICPICQTNFTTKVGYKRHRKECLHRNSNLNCRFCDKQFTTKESCIVHTRVAHNEKSNILRKYNKYNCHICKNQYISQVTLDRHLLLHKKRGEGVPCPFCAKLFTTKSRVTLHIRKLHNKEKRYKCELCDNRYFYESSLKVHQLRHHLNESELKIETDFVMQGVTISNPLKIEETQEYIAKVNKYDKKEQETEISKEVFNQKKISQDFPCYDCKSTFIYRKELLLHIKKVHITPLSDSKTYCDICKNNFPSIQSLYKDLQAHSKNNEIELSVEENKCPFCSRNFSHIFILRKHVEIFHKKALASCENGIEIICPICQTNFATKVGYNRHRKECLQRNSNLNCRFCDKQFTTKESCIVHTRVEHNEKSNILRKYNKYNCHICKNQYISQVTLDRHLLLHKNQGDGKNMPCPFCAKLFTTKSRVTLHIRAVHNKEKRYKCELCDNRYFDGSGLKVHQLRHHLNEANFNCTFCDKSFFTSCALTVHQRKHNGDSRYKCEFEGCKKVCSQLSELKFHIRSSHTGERNFKCKYCDKNFITKQHLKQHSDRNHPETPRQRTHICTICQNGFYTKSDLTKHVKNVHKKVKK